ncbi:haloacid dehalogenase [Niveispirillum lacus]|uniref:Haloacid dehalogenase n=1 Tax=Niveispirillum lacus TaxID=1981099 RepID=A0A255Z1P1_9PROT|nr:HAD family phosphatase [Niveispirillum lacus]OYQ35339.1 haloacid dehalogenase [Niveispirillum lacus]
MPLPVPGLPRPIHAVIFDMDGLLIDTERHVRSATLGAAAAIGRPMDDAFYAGIIGTPWPETLAMLKDFFGGQEGFDQFRAHFTPRMDALRQGVAMMTGVLELLDRLEALGLPKAVATSTGREKADEHLRHVGIHHRFTAIVTRDDVTRGKPHPEPYLTAAGLLEVDPAHCLALEDSHNGIRSAHEAGMMAIMVPDLLPATDDMRRLAVHVATDLHEVRLMLG